MNMTFEVHSPDDPNQWTRDQCENRPAYPRNFKSTTELASTNMAQKKNGIGQYDHTDRASNDVRQKLRRIRALDCICALCIA
jgi:hypothetical protein